MKASNIIYLVLSVLVVFSKPVVAWENNKLLFWSKAENNFGDEGVRKIARQFTLDTGAEVEVFSPSVNDPTVDYNQLVVLERGPDIFLRAHDRIGEMAQAGLIAKVTPSRATINSMDTTFWNAVRYDGDYYGYPISVEGPTQICNASLVNRPYRTVNEIAADQARLKRQNKTPIMFQYLDNYFVYGFVTAEGGYAFEYRNGAYNPARTGVNTRGAKSGITSMQRLHKLGILPSEIDYGIFDSAFKRGEAACVINGPWSWQGYKNAGIELLIGPYPKVGAGNPKGFIGVLTAVINPSSPNQALAKKFMEEYFLQPEGLKLINDAAPIGAATHTEFMKTLARQDKLLADAHAVWKNGEPMPNIPKMAKYWTHMDTAIANIFQKNESVSKSLDDAASRITR